MKMKKMNKWLIVVCWCCFPAGLMALSTDPEQPLKIGADKATLDNAKGETVYLGNVDIKQGSLHLKAAQVTLFYGKNKNIHKIVAKTLSSKDEPVYFRQLLDNGEEVKANARQMRYEASRDMLHLEGNAKVWKDKDTVTGEHIVYDAKNGQITAQGRVNMVIEPVSKPQKKSATDSKEPKQ